MEQLGLIELDLNNKTIKLTGIRRRIITNAQAEKISVIDEAKGEGTWKKMSSLTSQLVGHQNRFETEVYNDLQQAGWLSNNTFLQTLKVKKKTAKTISFMLTVVFFILPTFLL